MSLSIYELRGGVFDRNQSDPQAISLCQCKCNFFDREEVCFACGPMFDKTRPGAHVDHGIVASVPFQMPKAARKIPQNMRSGQVLEISQIDWGEPELEQCVDYTIEHDSCLRAKILRDFTPLGKFSECVLMDLSCRESRGRLSKVPAVALSKMAPLIIGPCFDSICCFPQNLSKRAVRYCHPVVYWNLLSSANCTLVSRPRNNMYFVAIKMGRRQGGPSRTGPARRKIHAIAFIWCILRFSCKCRSTLRKSSHTLNES
jgi:hypothetical protein